MHVTQVHAVDARQFLLGDVDLALLRDDKAVLHYATMHSDVALWWHAILSRVSDTYSSR